MAGAGMAVESSKGECNDGQHEINFHFGPALRTADEHTVYKTAREGDRGRRGHVDHVHGQVRPARGVVMPHPPLAAARRRSRCSPHDEALFERFVAGQLACLRELTLFYAPNVNSYKRFAKGSFAPTAVAWGRDNRTCAVRVVGHGDALRLELRVPGADVNPYLALAAMIAAGLHGLDAELELEEALPGNAYTSDKPHVPATLTRGPRPVRRQRGGARTPSARRSSTTTSTTPGSSSRRSRPT